MSIVQVVGSVNKISLLAFLATLVFFGYELYLFLKEKRKHVKPVIPQFDSSIKTTTAASENVAVKQDEPFKRTSNRPLILILFVMLVLFGGFTVYSLFTASVQNSSQKPTVIIMEMSSPGIRLFDMDWKEIKTNLVKPGSKIIIGLETIKGVEIDRGRIRVNENMWNMNKITSQFNKTFNVYFVEYTVATGEQKLKIEAQLHSPEDGWLGE